MRLQVLCILVLSFASVPMLTHSVRAGEDAKGDRPKANTVSPAILPKGTPCKIRLFPEQKALEGSKADTVWITYEGRVDKATDKGLTLIVSEERRVRQRTTPASELPYVGSLFTLNSIQQNKSPQSQEKTVSIPVEKIQSITLLVNAEPMARKVAPEWVRSSKDR